MANEAKQQQTAVAERPAPKETNDPYGDPVAYLRAKGWKCLGNPDWPTARWIDPTQPAAAHYTTEDILVPQVIEKKFRDDRDGLEKTRLVEELQHVMVQDGRGKQVRAQRTVYHPKATPVPIEFALLAQMERDAAATAKEKAK